MQNIIEISDLVKTFVVKNKDNPWYRFLNPKTTQKKAVNKISFDLKKGDFVGFLGPNGAGKSTTIKMLTGILTPTSGQVLVNGIVPYKNRRQHSLNMGVVFGQRTQLWWDLPPLDSFKLLAKMYKVPITKYQQNLTYFTELLDLYDCLHIPVRKLSLGQKMRCELVAALLHEPEILFLDEPTIGLDLFAKETIRDFLKKINQNNKTTILLTTHDLDDIENLCQKVIIIDKGKIIQQDFLANLKSKLGKDKVIAFEIDPHEKIHIPQGCQLLKNHKNIYYLEYTDTKTPFVIQEVLKVNTVHDISFAAADITKIIKKAYVKD